MVDSLYFWFVFLNKWNVSFIFDFLEIFFNLIILVNK